ncbi:MAG: hypothetical protein M0006_14930 [Magnetospirillum sp.]|nr:hypothetical protein [Magnetospirillum sp.]
MRSGNAADNDSRRLERHFARWERRLPPSAARGFRRLRHPEAKRARVALGSLLVAGGLLGILPVLGFWMLPLGLILLAQDFPPLKRLVFHLHRRRLEHRRRKRRSAAG